MDKEAAIVRPFMGFPKACNWVTQCLAWWMDVSYVGWGQEEDPSKSICTVQEKLGIVNRIGINSNLIKSTETSRV